MTDRQPPDIHAAVAAMPDGAVRNVPDVVARNSECEAADREYRAAVTAATPTKQQLTDVDDRQRKAEIELQRLLDERGKVAVAVLSGEVDESEYARLLQQIAAHRMTIEICTEGRPILEARSKVLQQDIGAAAVRATNANSRLAAATHRAKLAIATRQVANG